MCFQQSIGEDFCQASNFGILQDPESYRAALLAGCSDITKGSVRVRGSIRFRAWAALGALWRMGFGAALGLGPHLTQINGLQRHQPVPPTLLQLHDVVAGKEQVPKLMETPKVIGAQC